MKQQKHDSSPSKASQNPPLWDDESRGVNPNTNNPNTRMPKNKRKCPRRGVSERAALNRKRALELRIDGSNYRRIAAELGVSLDTAWHYVNDEIAGIATESARTWLANRENDMARAVPLWLVLDEAWPGDALGLGNLAHALVRNGDFDGAAQALANAPKSLADFWLYDGVSRAIRDRSPLVTSPGGQLQFLSTPDLGGALKPEATPPFTCALRVEPTQTLLDL